MKLWQVNQSIDERIESFTVGQDRDLDLYLATFDVYGSLAHIHMLSEVGLLQPQERIKLHNGLLDILATIEQGKFVIEKEMEDVHSQIEWMLTNQYGDIGKKIHTGRSRNDQVLVDLRLFFRQQIQHIVEQQHTLIKALMDKAKAHQNDLMPGYTHLQVGMVSSFGLWFSAYAESLIDDLKLWAGIFNIINQNPLGSAAGYGSSFPIDRTITTHSLGFKDLCYNSIHAQLGRGKSELNMAFGMAATGATIGKLAMDITLFCNQNHQFIVLPEQLTTGSSIMPHKKNPDVFELIRGRANQLMSLPTQIAAITNTLPTGYHRDFQLIKEVLFPAFEHLEACLTMLAYAIPYIEIQPNLLNDEKYQYVFSVESVNQLVTQGIPFREAYQIIAKKIKEGTFTKPDHIGYTHLGSIQNPGFKQITQKLDNVLRSFSFGQIEQAIQLLTQRL